MDTKEQTQKPQPQDYGYQEGGEEAYYEALEKWSSNQIKKAIEKHFGFDLKVKYYHPSDSINQDNYIRYEYLNNAVILSIGSYDGEVKVGLFTDPNKLTQLIDLIIY